MGWDEGVDLVVDTERHGIEDVARPSVSGPWPGYAAGQLGPPPALRARAPGDTGLRAQRLLLPVAAQSGTQAS